MGIAMIRVEAMIPGIDVKDGNTNSDTPKAPNPTIFAMIHIKNCLLK
jgi:hypothetical protein